MHRPIMSLLSVCMSEDVSLICVCMDYILAQAHGNAAEVKLCANKRVGGGGFIEKNLCWCCLLFLFKEV